MAGPEDLELLSGTGPTGGFARHGPTSEPLLSRCGSREGVSPRSRNARTESLEGGGRPFRKNKRETEHGTTPYGLRRESLHTWAWDFEVMERPKARVSGQYQIRICDPACSLVSREHPTPFKAPDARCHGGFFHTSKPASEVRRAFRLGSGGVRQSHYGGTGETGVSRVLQAV